MTALRVNQDVDNPLRLLAVSKDRAHYFTGIPCVRNHIANHYAKSGRCVECCHEDRRKFKKTPKGKASQRRKDDARHFRRTGKIRGAGPHWVKRFALYEQLVEAGLPVDLSIPLARRVHNTWDAFQELTSDTPDTVRHVRQQRMMHADARRAERDAKKQQVWADIDQRRAERERQRAEREQQRLVKAVKSANWRVEHTSRAKYLAEARANGIPVTTLRNRVYQHGWTWERACSTPVETAFKPNGLAAEARANGLTPELVTSRIGTLGWSREKALTTPVMKGPKEDSRAALARAAGLDPNLVDGRVAKGWSLEKALSTPKSPHKLTPDERARREIEHAEKIEARRIARAVKENASRAAGRVLLAEKDAARQVRREAARVIEAAREAKRVERAARMGRTILTREDRDAARAEWREKIIASRNESANRRAVRAVRQFRREEAAVEGLTTFENPTPCKHCGGVEFYTSGGTCKTCVSHRARREYVPMKSLTPVLFCDTGLNP